MFFDDMHGLLRVIVVGTLAYAGCILVMRLSGNRTLSKLNSFDLIITVAFGSTLSSIVISSDIALAEGLLAIALLVLLQFMITWLSVRSSAVNSVIKTAPTLLLSNGHMIAGAMRKVRITSDEIRTAVRQKGLGGLDQVAAVILETDGSLSIIPAEKLGSGSALDSVWGWENMRQA
jgi:uncharacterized membrane protein YcaP (DUF421 family)